MPCASCPEQLPDQERALHQVSAQPPRGSSDCSQDYPEPVSHPSCPSWVDSTILKSQRSGWPLLSAAPRHPRSSAKSRWCQPTRNRLSGTLPAEALPRPPCALCSLHSSQSGLFLLQGHSVPTASGPLHVPSALSFAGPAHTGLPPTHSIRFTSKPLNSFPEWRPLSRQTHVVAPRGGRPSEGPGPAVGSELTEPKPLSLESCR